MPKFSVKKPLTVFVSVLAVIVLGVVAYLKMTPDLLPNMDFPYVIVVTTDPGASPETVEEVVTRPMEQSMATLDQIKSVTSTSQNSVSIVVMEFEDGVNMDTISVDIQQKISVLQGSWDEMIGAPYVLKINPSMLPVMVAGVSYDGHDVTELSDFMTDTLNHKLEGISGVASVDISGTIKRELHIILNQEKMDSLAEQLADAINEKLNNAASDLKKTRAQVQSAKSAISRAEGEAVESAVSNALKEISESIKTLQAEQEATRQRAETLLQLQQEKAAADAELALKQASADALNARKEAGTASEEELNELAALQADILQLQARQAELDAQIAAAGSSWESVTEDIRKLQDAIEEIGKLLTDLEDENSAAKLAKQVSDGVVGITDAVTQIVSASVQIDDALTKIDEGLATIESSRTAALKSADLGGMLSLNTVTGLLTAQNFSMPAGYLQDDGINYMVSVGDEITTLDDLSGMLLFDMGLEGIEPIRLSDVADVFITDNSDEVYAKLNGSDGIIATFTKQSNFATADVSDKIAERFESLEEEFPGLHFAPLMDQGDYIYLIVKTILSSLGWGALFSILVLYLFLKDWRPTVITLCSIPISVIFAVVLMYFSGVTINMISLSGLAVAVGMLVDNSVVVIENIYRLRAKGATVIQAAVSGAGQVVGAIVASTLTTVCVFVPIVFVEGITRQLFTDLALTMTYSLMASLIVALTLVPAMASGLLRKEKEQKPGILDKVYPVYRKAISWSLDHKAAVLSGALALLLVTGFLALRRGFAFMPEIDMNNVTVSISMPEDATMEEAAALADEVLKRAATVEDIETIGATMGGGSLSSLSGGGGGSYDVTCYITLPEGKFGLEAGRKIEKLCEDMDCKVTSAGVMSMMTYLTGSGVAVQVYGDDMEDLQTAAKSMAAAMEEVEGTRDVSDGLEDAASALHVAIDRDAAMQKGMTVAQIYMQIASALTESASGTAMTLDGKNVSVLVETAEESHFDRQKLLTMEITGTNAVTQEEISFPLSDVAKLEETVSLNSIARDQQRRYLTVSAGVAEGYNVTRVTSSVQKALDAVTLPDGITVEYAGENEAIMDAMEQLLLMMLIGIILVYFIMVAQFQSLKSPFIVMFTIPLAFTGGFLALLIARIEVSVISLIGFVMLVGIIVNNGIVLVDYINQQRLAGMERREAIVDAGVTRLRPILMTSLTTILGLIVMALAKNAGTALMQPVALVCIGGLLYATLMTLFVVPCMYEIMNRKELRKVSEEELKELDM